MHPALVKKLIYPIHEKIMGRNTFAYLQELEQQQWFSQEQLDDLRFRKLRESLIHNITRQGFLYTTWQLHQDQPLQNIAVHIPDFFSLY